MFGLEQALVMEQEVLTLLRKEAIEMVPPHDRGSGFCSRYFIVPKKDGGLRPILQSVTEVQDAHSQAGHVSDQVQGLVCHDRSKRPILSHLHLSPTQEVPEVCFWGQSLTI